MLPTGALVPVRGYDNPPQDLYGLHSRQADLGDRGNEAELQQDSSKARLFCCHVFDDISIALVLDAVFLG